MTTPSSPTPKPHRAEAGAQRGERTPALYLEEGADPLGWRWLGNWAGFVLRAPRRHKALAAGTFAFILAFAMFLIYAMPFRYQVHAVVLAQRNPLMSTLSNPGVNRDWDVPTRAAREVVIRRDNLIALSQQVDFVDRYLESRPPAVRMKDWLVRRVTGKERDRDELLDQLLDTLEDRLWVVAGPEGTLRIGFEWSNPELAFDVVDAALQSFLESKYANEIKAVGEAIAILESHDDRIQKQIATTVAQLEEKERALRIRSGPRRVPVVRRGGSEREDVTRLETNLAARRRALADLEAFRQQRLSEMQAQLVQQQAVYAPGHPAVASTRQAIESLSGPSPQILALRGEVHDLETEIARRGGRAPDAPDSNALEAQLAEARLRLLDADDPRLEVERRQLEDLLRHHSTLLQRIDSARVEMDTSQAAFKYRYSVITPPLLPDKPMKPYVLTYVLGGIIGGIAMALFVAVAADLRQGRVIERWQVEEDIKIEVLGEIRR